jgi:hypothetical protein
LKVLARAVGKLGAVMAPSHPLAKRTSIRLSDCMDYPLVVADSSSAIRPYLDAAFTRVSLDLQPIIETNAIEIMRHAAILENGITFLTPFDIEFERRAGRLVYVAVRELSQDNQALMLIGHDFARAAAARSPACSPKCSKLDGHDALAAALRHNRRAGCVQCRAGRAVLRRGIRPLARPQESDLTADENLDSRSDRNACGSRPARACRRERQDRRTGRTERPGHTLR